MNILYVLLVCAAKILLDKTFALGIILLLLWIKLKNLKSDSDAMEEYLTRLEDRKLLRIIAWVYVCAALCSSAVCYGLLVLLEVRWAMQITFVMLLVGMTVTAYRFFGKPREKLLRRIREIRSRS